MSGGGSESAIGRRLEGLDAWRAVLMLGGLLLHGSVWKQPLPLFDAITVISHSFRMGSFFAISGFLCGMSLSKRPPREWLRRRLVQIGLPTVFGLAVICPLIGFLESGHPAGAFGHDPLPFDWYHLWFLVALLLYAPVAVVMDALEPRWRSMEQFGARGARSRSQLPLLLMIGGLSFLLMIGAGLAVSALASPRYVPTANEWRVIAGYLPLYLLGFAMARSSALQHTVRRSWRSPLTVVAATVLLYVGWFAWGVRIAPPAQVAWIDGLVQMTGAAFCPSAVFMLIFRSASTITRTPPLLGRLCDASLTMYLVHLPLLVAINLAFVRVGWNPYLEFGIAVLAAGLVAYVLHACLVRPVPLLRLLVNGRLDETPPAPRPSVHEARDHFAVGSADLHLST